jgi:hypothetical protein
MSEPSVAREPAQPEESRRQLLYVAGGLGLVVAVGVLALFVLHKKEKPPEPGDPAPEVHDERLLAALDQLDRLDPRWRFAELEEDREKVPDEKNAAPLVLKAALIPKPWQVPALDLVRDVRDRLRKGMLDENPRADIEPLTPALVEGRQLAGFSRGRHAVAWNFDNPLLTALPHLGATQVLVKWLALDAEVRAHEGEVDGALVSVRAALVAAKTIGDEPMLVSQGERLDWQPDCAQAVEEALRCGQGTDGPLFNVQTALADEAAEPVLRTAARAERAGLHALMTALEKGELTRADPLPLDVRADGVSLILGSVKLRRRESLEAIHAWLLEHTTKLVEIAGLPPEAQLAPLTKLAATASQAPPGGMEMAKALPLLKMGTEWQKGQAMLRCATAAVALERYRLANGRWPDKLDDVTPRYLTKVPADPYDGQPLRYARHKDVVVVYAIGPDGKDDGGKPDELNRFDKKDGFDVGFRLWNVEARHKAAK